MNKNKSVYIILFAIAIIWGGGYLALQQALDNNWPVFSILFFRNLAGFIVTFFIGIKSKFWKDKRTWLVGSIAGIIYLAGYVFQSFGQNLTTVTNTGLITGLGTIFNPFFYWIMFKSKPQKHAFIGCFIGLTGAFILGYNPGFKFHIGDILVFISAILYAMHLIYVGHEADDLNLFGFTSVQFLIMTIGCSIGMVVAKSPIIGDTKGFYGVGYYALISGLFGILGQFYCQRQIESYKVGLVLSLEGLFAAILSVILLKEEVSLQVIFGGITMLAAVFYVQLVDIHNLKKVENKIE